jgi:hypothetical protein
MTVTYMLDSLGNPEPCSDIVKWAEWFKTADRKVKRTRIGDILISTVFLGICYRSVNMQFENRLLFFETMIWNRDEPTKMKRYSKRSEALAGHRIAVREVIKDLRNEL